MQDLVFSNYARPGYSPNKVLDIIQNPAPYDYLTIGQIPLKENHHDPFDRMLIQQAIRNNLVLISKDEKFRQYEENGLQLLWE